MGSQVRGQLQVHAVTSVLQVPFDSACEMGQSVALLQLETGNLMAV